jgi:hypothetical protein
MNSDMNFTSIASGTRPVLAITNGAGRKEEASAQDDEEKQEEEERDVADIIAVNDTATGTALVTTRVHDVEPRASETQSSFIFCPEASGVLAPLHPRARQSAPVSTPSAVASPSTAPTSKALVESASAAHSPQKDGDGIPLPIESPPYLLLLVPAANLDASGSNGSDGDSWVEIGCHVANARLVTNVRFSVPEGM